MKTATKRIDWSTLSTSLDDLKLIKKIVKRAAAEGFRLAPLDPQDLELDLEATHSNGCPLRLQALLDADRFNFAHDVCGIQAHMDRETGQLTNHFLPRFYDAKAVQ